MTQAGKTVTGVMRAAEYDRYRPPSMLQTRTLTHPRVDYGHALVRVHASSVNPLDTIVRSGKLRFLIGNQFPKRTGIDFAGEVVEIETETPDIKVGDRVWGVMPLSVESGVGQGSAADFVTISTTRISSSPKSLNCIEAASISSIGAVAIIALRDKARRRPGERLLVRGAAGGMGAVQVGKLLGAHVTALASAKDLDFLKKLGADEALAYQTTTPVLATWHICTKIGLLGATSSTNNTPYCFMRDSIIISNFSQRFLLFKNTVQHSRPC